MTTHTTVTGGRADDGHNMAMPHATLATVFAITGMSPNRLFCLCLTWRKNGLCEWWMGLDWGHLGISHRPCQLAAIHTVHCSFWLTFCSVIHLASVDRQYCCHTFNEYNNGYCLTTAYHVCSELGQLFFAHTTLSEAIVIYFPSSHRIPVGTQVYMSQSWWLVRPSGAVRPWQGDTNLMPSLWSVPWQVLPLFLTCFQKAAKTN